LCINGCHGGARLEARDWTASFLRAPTCAVSDPGCSPASRDRCTCRVCILVDDSSLALKLLALVGQHRRVLLRHPPNNQHPASVVGIRANISCCFIGLASRLDRDATKKQAGERRAGTHVERRQRSAVGAIEEGVVVGHEGVRNSNWVCHGGVSVCRCGVAKLGWTEVSVDTHT